MEIHHINTDLEIESDSALNPIVEQFGDKVTVLHNGKFGDRMMASFEVECELPGPDGTISSFLDLIKALSGQAKDLWDKSVRRTFDIAFESGKKPKCFSAGLNPDTIRRVAAVNANIVITIYPVGSYSDEGEDVYQTS